MSVCLGQQASYTYIYIVLGIYIALGMAGHWWALVGNGTQHWAPGGGYQETLGTDRHQRLPGGSGRQQQAQAGDQPSLLGTIGQ